MASANDLRQALKDSHEAFKKGVEAAAGRWEQPGSGANEAGWSPRQVAEHVFTSEMRYADQIVSAMRGNPLAQKQFSFVTAQDSLSALPDLDQISANATKWVDDHDLTKPYRGATAPWPTIESIWQQAVDHMNEHARQIANG